MYDTCKQDHTWEATFPHKTDDVGAKGKKRNIYFGGKAAHALSAVVSLVSLFRLKNTLPSATPLPPNPS